MIQCPDLGSHSQFWELTGMQFPLACEPYGLGLGEQLEGTRQSSFDLLEDMAADGFNSELFLKGFQEEDREST